MKRRLIAVATGLTIVTVASTSGLRIHQAVTDKADWRHVAKFIAERTRPGDLVLTSNDWAAVCLAYYLPKVGAQVEIVSAKESVETADELARSRGQAFLVTGGFHVQRDVRTWMGQFFSLFESRLETIGIFFYPDRAAYLANRITQRELRQDDRLLWETHAGRLRFDANIERFLVDGWTHAEPDASGNTLRYSVGAAARLYVPISKSAPSVMKVQLRPINHVPLVLKIKVNDVVVGQHRLRPDWQELTVGFSEAPVRYGGNIVAFEFQAAVDAPSWDTNHGRRTTAFRSLEFIK